MGFHILVEWGKWETLHSIDLEVPTRALIKSIDNCLAKIITDSLVNLPHRHLNRNY